MANRLLLSLALLSCLWLAPAKASGGDAPAQTDPSGLVAVLNFENLVQGDAARAWLSKGLADLTIGDLASQQLRVVSREQMQEIVHELRLKKNLGDPQSVARVLKASRCVHGTYQVLGGQVELFASIVEVNTSKQVHAAKVTGPEGNLLGLQKKLAAELADVLRGDRPGTLDSAKLPRWTESLAASQLLYQGIDLFDRGDYLTAWGLFRRALRQDGRYADALYWAGRMMYYTQEYHQARLDLERFAVENARHPRVGDAVMEIINAVQLSAAGADEVFQALKLAVHLAPRAEVANQFGAGQSSNVALYCATLAAQIYGAEKRYREAFDFFADQLQTVPRDESLYWVAWNELFKIKVAHFKATSEILTMPATPGFAKMRPRFSFLKDDVLLAWEQSLYGPAVHPLNQQRDRIADHGGFNLSGDVAMRRPFHQFHPDNPVVAINFSKDPLVPKTRRDPLYPAKDSKPNTMFLGMSFTRYFAAPPGYFLSGYDVEVRYRNDGKRKFFCQFHNEDGLESTGFPLSNASKFDLDGKGMWKKSFDLPPGRRAIPMGMVVLLDETVHESDSTTAGILSWKVTGRLCRAAPSATLILHGTGGMYFRAKLNGKEVPAVQEQPVKIDLLPPGDYTLSYFPWVSGPQASAQTKLKLGPGEMVEVALSARVDIRRRAGYAIPYAPKTIGNTYAMFRMGAPMGDTAGWRPGDLSFLEDRQGRWIVAWNQRRDLYLLTSSDRGQTWSATARLPAPVNSAHEERSPCLMQDSDGRYVLLFTSDRNLARAHVVYACWSEDLVNFSAPVMVAPDPGRPACIRQRPDGTYLAYLYTFNKDLGFRELVGGLWQRPVAVCTSTDLVNWTRPKEIIGAKRPAESFNAMEDGGNFIALSSHVSPSEWVMKTSSDGIHFENPAAIPFKVFPSEVSLRRVDGKLFAVSLSSNAHCEIFRHEGDNRWKSLRRPGGMPAGELRHTAAAVPGEKAVICFGLPVDYRGSRGVFTLPLLPTMVTTDYERETLPAGHPLTKLPPTNLEARIIKRHAQEK